ncbi:FecR domain-containing protein [Stratiformator vulcanicus]|uniref:FecR protein n=1 Tax=Stratiformator vulcanicus TaxID=2527980 RepID=A0A517QWT6_9PLAN|nr:FecR domain-containing protein [Stratiformator vulcanicus]QDT36064.1 FecR protein [Stratiformator vulcanicus]
MNQRFQELWADFLEGDLDESGIAELDELLASNDDLLKEVGDLYEQHRMLGLLMQPYESRDFVDSVKFAIQAEKSDFVNGVVGRLGSRPRSGIWSGLTIVASTLMVSVLSVWTFAATFPRGTREVVVERIVTRSNEYVATLARAEDCRWSGRALPQGSRLMAGPLQLNSGTALIRFDGGATARITGPVVIDLHSAGEAELHSGRAVVRAPEEAAGFILRTPAKDLIDLGTEFAADVSLSGETELHVLEGEVRFGGRSGRKSVLAAGNSRRFDLSSDGFGETISFDPERFQNSLPVIDRSRIGRLTARESFDYPFAEAPGNEAQADDGLGWKSHWYRTTRASKLPVEFSPDVLLPTPIGLASAEPGCLTLPTEETDWTYREASKRLLSHPIDLDSDGVWYASFLIRPGVSTGDKYQWLQFILNERTKDWATKTRLGAGILSNNRPIIHDTAGNTVGETPLVDGATYLFVIKVVTGSDRPEQVFLKVYGSDDRVDSAEPVVWTVVGRTASHHGKIDSVHIFNGPGRRFDIDDIRCGTSWEAVTPLADDASLDTALDSGSTSAQLGANQYSRRGRRSRRLAGRSAIS